MGKSKAFYTASVQIDCVSYTGDVRRGKKKARASAARVALEDLGMPSGTHISNITIMITLEQVCGRMPRFSYDRQWEHQEPVTPIRELLSIAQSVGNPLSSDDTELGYHTFHQDVAEACIKVLYRVCCNLGVEYNRKTIRSAVVMDDGHAAKIIVATSGSNFILNKDKLFDCESVRDCHAEVLARRGLVLFLLREISKAQSRYSEVMIRRNEKYYIRHNIKFHLYISTVPCGDAGKDGRLSYRMADGEGNVYETRPHRLYKMSCRDKIALWNVVGVQGALLSELIAEPVFLSSIIVEDSDPSKESLEKAFFNRIEKLEPHCPNVVVIKPTSRSEIRSAHKAVCWVANDDEGGVIFTKTGLRESGSTDVSKYNLFKLWMDVAKCDRSLSYNQCKKKAKEYQRRKKQFQDYFSDNKLGVWYDKLSKDFKYNC